MPLYIALLNCFLTLLMLVFNWRMNRNIIFLVLIILVISIYSITYIFIAIDPSRFWAALLYANLAPIWYLPGPCLYFYVRGNLEDRIRLRKSDLLHLLPFVISLIGIFPYLLSPFQQKLETVDALFLDPNIPKLDSPNWLLSVEWNLFLRPALLIVYAIFCIGMVVKSQRTFSSSSAVAQDQWVFLRNWMILLSGILFLIGVPSLFLSYFYSFDIQIDYSKINSYSMSSATVYSLALLSMALLFSPRILYGIPKSTLTHTYFNKFNPPLTVVERSEDQPDSSGPIGGNAKDWGQIEGPFVELSRRVLQFMEEQKPYIDTDFTIEVLAKSMGVPKHHLYYCFQTILKKKFTRLRTEYRIEHAKTLLIEADLTKITINHVGKESGFASTTAFYTTFKSEVGCSPGEFAAGVNPSYQG